MERSQDQTPDRPLPNEGEYLSKITELEQAIERQDTQRASILSTELFRRRWLDFQALTQQNTLIRDKAVRCMQLLSRIPDRS